MNTRNIWLLSTEALLAIVYVTVIVSTSDDGQNREVSQLILYAYMHKPST